MHLTFPFCLFFNFQGQTPRIRTPGSNGSSGLNFFEEGPFCFPTRDHTLHDGGVDNTKDQILKELIHHRKVIGAFSVDQIFEFLRKKKK